MYEGDAKQTEKPKSILDEIEAQLKLNERSGEAECWPDNWLPLQVFDALDTQWNIGPGGVVGLKYEALDVVFEEFEIKKTERAELINTLRTMETEALQVINQR